MDLVCGSAAKRGLNLRLAWAMRCGFDLQLALVVKHCSARLALFCCLREWRNFAACVCLNKIVAQDALF